MSGNAPSSEWASGWTAVLVGIAGMALTGISVYVIGLVMQPMQAEFGWSRTEISSGLIINAVIAVIGLPLIGRVADRIGARALALPGTLLSGLSFAAFALSNGSLPLWWATWVAFGLSLIIINPTIWAASVARLFVKGRGLALGIVMCGTAVGALTVPHLARWSIDSFGWRSAFLTVGATYSLIPFFLALFFLREPADQAEEPTAGEPPAASSVPGLSFREAMTSPAIIKILLATFLVITLIVAINIHFIPLMAEHGVSRLAATGIVSAVGLASIVGKLAVGWVMDRSRSRVLPALCYALPAVTCALLFVMPTGNAMIALVAALLSGVASGSVMQLSAFLVIQYAGLRAFGQIYGIVGALLAVCGGLGPLVGAVAFDTTGSYWPMLMGGIPLTLAMGALIATLDRFPDFSQENAGTAPNAAPG